MVLATRHIGGEFARSVGLDDLRPTAVLTPGVLGQTGTESGEIVRGVCTVVHPVAVVVVDALPRAAWPAWAAPSSCATPALPPAPVWQ